MPNSIGMIETRGFVPAVTAADSMVKSASVEIIGQKEVGDGLVAIIVKGEVGAVKAAVEAGAEAANSVGEVVSMHVIPRPNADVDEILTGE